MKAQVTPLRSKEERDELVEQYLPLVRYVIGRLPVTMPASLDRDDFFSVGVMGLMHAAANYDAGRGASFKTFAYTAIRGAVLDEIRKNDPLPRSRRDRLRRLNEAKSQLSTQLGHAPSLEQLAEHMSATPEELDEDLLALHTAKILSLDEPGKHDSNLGMLVVSPGADPSAGAIQTELIDTLAKCMSNLPEVERHVLVLYHYESLYLKEIGNILGVSESRVSQILSRATERLRLKMNPGNPEKDGLG